MRTRDFFIFLLAVITLGYIGVVVTPRLPCGFAFPLKAEVLKWGDDLTSYACEADEGHYEILVVDKHNNKNTFLRVPKEELAKGNWQDYVVE